MSPTIKCFQHPMKLREIRCQRILTSTKVADEETFGYELFVSKIPLDSDEDELIPFFEKVGPLHTFRLMMKSDQCINRGHAYITYIYESDAKDAVSILNGKEIRNGYPISVARSYNNCRIFIGGIPVNKTKDEVWHELQKQDVPNIVDVIMYRSYSNRNINRGFVFVEFPSHKFAAKMRLKLRGLKLWNHEVVVDWSVPQPVVTDDDMATVKIIYLRNLNVTLTREDLRKEIEKYINPQYVEKVYKFKDYAFVHISSRELALQLIEHLQEHFRGTCVEVSLAKPRNNFTRPGYRKYQMMKNTPYLPKRNEESSNPDLQRILSSTPVDVNFYQTPSHTISQNWLHSLPLSPVNSTSTLSPYDISPEDEIEQFLNEDRVKQNFNFHYPPIYHFQNGAGNFQRCTELKGLTASTFNTKMNKLNMCCSRDYFSIFQEDGYKY